MLGWIVAEVSDDSKFTITAIENNLGKMYKKTKQNGNPFYVVHPKSVRV